MEQIDNSQPTYKELGTENRQEPGHQRGDNRFHQTRRNRFIRKTIFTAFLALGLVMLLFVGREWLYRNGYRSAMSQLAEQISDFRESHQCLPSREQMLKFELHTRVSPETINYEPAHIIDSSPSDTLLAYSPPLDLKFLPGDYAVLLLDGSVHWLSRPELEEKIKMRDRHYNASILREKTSKDTSTGSN